MTAPAAPEELAGGDRRRLMRRRVALGAVLALIVATALLTPELAGRSGDPRLTTYSADPLGARLLYELAGRLGWQVERRTDDSLDLDSRTVWAILDPPQPLAGVEVHRLLERVRAGGALLYVLRDGGSPLEDSLHLKRSKFGGTYVGAAAGTAEAPPIGRASDSLRARRFETAATGQGARPDGLTSDTTGDGEELSSAECAGKEHSGGAISLWGDETVHLWRLTFTRPRPSDAVIFARASVDSGRPASGIPEPAAVGFGLGRGRIVAVSDPDQLRNDVLRVCHWGLDVVAVRMLEYLATGAAGPRDHLVFDEYHQGFGAHPGTLRAISHYLSRAPSGHVLLQCLLGGLVLLLAWGPRAVPAHDPERVERRSPLEQVGALARAYERVGATRTATARLLHGVRRRLERTTHGRLGGVTDEAFLDDAVRTTPGLGEDVALIRRGLATPIAPRELEAVGGALSRLEQTLQTQRR